MYKASSATRIIGNNLVYLESVGSTNSWASEFSKTEKIKDGMVFITDHQTAGRGQMGNSWITEPKTNLTFSIVLLDPVTVQEQFYLTVFVTLALGDLLNSILSQVQIKWPNDILVNQKKIAGILIENQVRGSKVTASVIGIGLNVNQQLFGIDHATSIRKESGQMQSLSDTLGQLLSCLDERYFQLRNGMKNLLRDEWHNVLYLKGLPHVYRSNGRSFEGVITGVDDDGRLAVETDEGQRIFGFKEISY